jgi:hypothetical protein
MDLRRPQMRVAPVLRRVVPSESFFVGADELFRSRIDSICNRAG